MTDKLQLLLLFGGQSCEHEVSVTSARSMIDAIDCERFHVIAVGITRQGEWVLPDNPRQVFEQGRVSVESGASVYLDYSGNGCLRSNANSDFIQSLDIVFPLLHGTNGEDGALQGLLELANVAYVGSGVGGSAVGMDKELMRKAFSSVGLDQAKWSMVYDWQFSERAENVIDDVLLKLSFPLFVKPASQGSSVGISKVHDRAGLIEGIREALHYDYKVMVEESVENAHEVECAVLGNDRPKASVVGEIIPGAEFYNYETKYIDDKSQLVIPADLDTEFAEEIRKQSIIAFEAVGAAGLSRVDFLVRPETRQIIINEINTMPGFTPISMYPKLWQESGLEYGELISQLVDLGLERYKAKLARNASI